MRGMPVALGRTVQMSNLNAERLIEAARRIAREVPYEAVTRAEDDPRAGGAELLSMTRALLDAATRLLDEAQATYENTDAQEVADVAAMASGALDAKRQMVGSLDERADVWEVIDRCDRSLRAIFRATTGFENALCDWTNTPPQLALDDELEKGLRVRSAYSKFRSAVREAILAADKPLAHRLRSAGTALAILTGRTEYASMRVGDRILVRKLQRRIIGWLVAADSTVADGEHLASELLAVGELLMAINSRAELVEYDRQHPVYDPGSANVAGKHLPTTT